MYNGLANRYMNTQAPNIDYGGANQYMGLGNQARGAQSNALSLEQQAAMGNAPSQAAIMMKQGNDQAMANQLSLAAGARGPAAMAMAQQQAAGNTANLQTQNINNTGALRAQEMANARGSYMSGASGMRSQDLASQQQMAQQAQQQAQLGLGYGQLGLQGGLGFSQLGFNVNNAQLGASQNMAQLGNLHWGQQAALDQASLANATNNVWKGIGVASDALGGAIGGAGGGPGGGAGAANGSSGGSPGSFGGYPGATSNGGPGY
jgi:hypothetical protein